MEETVTTWTIAEAVEQLFDVAGKGLEFITGNQLMFLTFVSGFAFLGFSLIRKAKKTARG